MKNKTDPNPPLADASGSAPLFRSEMTPSQHKVREECMDVVRGMQQIVGCLYSNLLDLEIVLSSWGDAQEDEGISDMLNLQLQDLSVVSSVCGSRSPSEEFHLVRANHPPQPTDEK